MGVSSHASRADRGSISAPTVRQNNRVAGLPEPSSRVPSWSRRAEAGAVAWHPRRVLVDLTDDAEAVARLRWEWARAAHPTLTAEPDHEFVAAVREWMDDATRAVWVATADQPVGMVCLTEYTRMPSPSQSAGGRWGYLGHLYVRPEARGDGVGEALVRALLAESVRRGHAKVVLSPTAASIPVYTRCGFTADNDLMFWRF